MSCDDGESGARNVELFLLPIKLYIVLSGDTFGLLSVYSHDLLLLLGFKS